LKERKQREPAQAFGTMESNRDAFVHAHVERDDMLKKRLRGGVRERGMGRGHGNTDQ